MLAMEEKEQSSFLTGVVRVEELHLFSPFW
jgi:hypothetical protein